MENNITSLDRCGIFQKQECLKELCPLWSQTEGLCVADISGTMLSDMVNKVTFAINVWQRMDNKQRLQAGLSVLKKMSEG
jgi:hypothetical protein